MATVGIRELKHHFSFYLRQVRAGGRVRITDRGRLVAEMVPPGQALPDPDLPQGLLDLAQQGLLTLAPKPARLSYARPGAPLLRSGTARQLLDGERAE